MGLFLVFEGTWAVGIMSIVFTVALLGVAALGWYVIRCDTQNRYAERDLLASDTNSGGPAVTTVQQAAEAPGPAPATATALAQAPAPVHGGTDEPVDAVSGGPGAATPPAPPAQPHRPRRRR